jgi:hypothetical protein
MSYVDTFGVPTRSGREITFMLPFMQLRIQLDWEIEAMS